MARKNKTRLTYDIEPELLEEVDRQREKQRPIKLSRNAFFSLAVSYYLKFINEKGELSKNEKIL